MYPLPTSPQPLGKVLDQGFQLYVMTLQQALPLSFAVAALNLLLELWLPPPVIAALPGSPEFSAEMLSWLSEVAPQLLIFALFSLILSNALLYRIGAFMYGRENRLGLCLGAALSRLPSVILATLIYVAAVFAGSLFMLLPGLFLSMTLFFYMPLILLDNEGPLGALIQSHRLVWGHWWATSTLIGMAALMLLGAIGVATLLLYGLLFSVLGFDEDSIQQLLKFTNMILGALLNPLLYAMILATYHDLKVRREEANRHKAGLIA